MSEPGRWAKEATALAPSIFGTSANPIPTGESILSPPITIGTLNVFHLPGGKCCMYF